MAAIHRAMPDAATTLASGYTAGSGSMGVVSAALLSPSSAVPYIIRVRAALGGPYVTYEVTNVVTNTLTVARIGGAADQNWAAGTPVENIISAYAWERLRTEYLAHTHDGTNSTSFDAAARTLQNKTLDNTNVIVVKAASFGLEATADATKDGVFNLNGITPGNVRTLSWPDASGTIQLAPTWVAWTPTIKQSGTLGITAVTVEYAIVGKVAHVKGKVTINDASAAVASQAITIEGVPAAIAPVNTGHMYSVGNGIYFDAGTAYYLGALINYSSTVLRLLAHNTGDYIGVAPAFTAANNDELSFTGSWKIA